jgi:hypothetical protein
VTKSGNTVTYSMLVSALTGEVLAAVNDRDEKMDLPIDLDALEETKAEDHRQDVLEFFSFIGTDDPSWAVRQLSSALSPDEASAQAWLANFASIDSLTVVAIEQARLEEWTSEWECFKVTLQVETQETPDKFGWDNGSNTRWVTIVPQGAGAWKINAFDSNP